jgi:transposase
MLFQVLLLVVTTAAAGVRSSPARRDFEGMERRRRRAARMFERGATQADVARELEVSRQSARRWYADWRAGGTKALKAAGRAGRMPRLSEAQLRRVDRALRQGPRAHGFATDVWTLARVAEVIEAETGVRYHAGHVWKVLRKMGWTRQRPARRAAERDDEAIARWVAEDWPRIKRGPAGGERGSSSKTSRASHSSPR